MSGVHIFSYIIYKCNYLDLCISIYRGSFRVVRYDKREDYSLKVISYPFLDGNVPKNLSYGVFISQLYIYIIYI